MEEFQWIKIKDELPESGSTIAVKLNDGQEHVVCTFATRRQAMTHHLSLRNPAKEGELQARIEKAEADGGEYQVVVWEGFKSYEVKFEDIAEWKYKHRLNEFALWK